MSETIDDLPLHPSYDFNDDVLAFGVRWFVAMARLALHDTSDTPRQP